MPEFHLDISGEVAEPVWTRPPMLTVGRPLTWRDLDAFTQGYIEALFFTAGNNCGTLPGPDADEDGAGDDVEVGFADLAPEALAAILTDCAKFQAANAAAIEAAQETPGYGYGEERGPCDDEHAGRDFWYTRAGHGCGFWDGDWPEPYAAQLTAASKAFRSLDAYLGDDGKVYL